jgi:hypothetical protein
VIYFNGDSSDASRLAEPPHLKQRSCTKALVAPARLDIEIIQTSDKPTVFHGEL